MLPSKHGYENGYTEMMPTHPRDFFSKIKLVLSILSVLLLTNIRVVHAQNSVGWADPILLTDEGRVTRALFHPPVILATDRYGYVHIFWREDSEPGVIMYARSNGVDRPIINDIIATETSYPASVFVDERDQINLTLVENNSDYSLMTVSLAQADNPRAWLDAGTVRVPGAIETGADGLWYAVRNRIDEAFLSVSTDNGATWTDEILLTAADSTGWLLNYTFLVDGSGRIHLTWTSAIERGTPAGQSLYYRYSDDRGYSWSEMQVLDQDDERYQDGYAPWTQELTLDSMGNIHLIWNGAPAGQRHYRTSRDGGQSWSNDFQIWPEHRGITGRHNLSEDSNGNLHMVTGSLQWGLYHAFLKNGVWQGPYSIHPDIGDAQNHVSAITGGNRLHAVWTNVIETGDVWYASALVDAPGEDPLPYPEVNISVNTTVAARSPEPTHTVPSSDHDYAGSQNNEVITLDTLPPKQNGIPSNWIGILSALGLVITVVVGRQLHK